MKYTLAGVAIVIVAIAGWWLMAPSAGAPEVQVPAAGKEIVQPTTPTAPAQTNGKEKEVPKDTSGITMAEVATHTSEASCWTVVNDSVYDVTSFIDKHPGGRRNVLKLCGVDGTAAFTGQHGGQGQPESTLAGFKIGTLAQ